MMYDAVINVRFTAWCRGQISHRPESCSGFVPTVALRES